MKRACVKLTAERDGTLLVDRRHDPERDTTSKSTPTRANSSRNVAGLYRGELWTPDLPHVEVWVESRSIASIVRRRLSEASGLPVPSGRVFARWRCAIAAAEEIQARARSRVVVLYIGDYDDDGTRIDKSIERELRSHLDIPLEIIRLGINEDQIQEYGLPTKPPKPGSKATIRQTVEAETLPAGIMRKLVRDAVESYLPAGQLAAVEAAERSERVGLYMLASYVEELGLAEINQRVRAS